MATDQFGLLCYATFSNQTAPQEPKPVESKDPTLPEIHLNIWERDDLQTGAQEAFLDIGLLFDLQEPAETVELIFPWKVEADELIDLGPLIASSDAVPAIFNESWAVIDHQGDCIVYDPQGVNPSFALVSFIGSEVSRKVFNATWGSGITQKTIEVNSVSVNVAELVLRAATSAKAAKHNIEKFYVRFRVLNIRKDFYCVGADNGGVDISAVLHQKTEDIDFRLNVRRGAPPTLEKNVGKFVEFSKVHLFLMRSRDKDIVFQDKYFKAARSLEDEDFWARYSLKTAGDQPTEIAANRKRVKRSLGYHWKAGGNGQPVKEFGTLARFRIVKMSIGRFLFWAVLLGIVGNLTTDLAKSWIDKMFVDQTTSPACIEDKAALETIRQSCITNSESVSPKEKAGRPVLKRD